MGELEHRVLLLEARNRALTNLLLSHILASDVFAEGVAAYTRRFAEDQLKAAPTGDPVILALRDLLDSLDGVDPSAP